MTKTLREEITLQRKQNLRIAILPHVGIAKSHLLRAIALNELLRSKFQTVLILPSSGREFVQQYFPSISCEWIDWHYGHNDVLNPLLSELVRRMKNTAFELERILTSVSADVVIGIPGFQSSAICRAIGIKHISILHGPWLLPEYRLSDLDAGETAVVDSWKTSIEITDTILRIIAQTFDLKDEGYEHWLENETVLVGQDFNGVDLVKQRPCIGFLSSDYGTQDCENLPNNALSLILGTALDGLEGRLFRVLLSRRSPMIIIGRDVQRRRKNAPPIYYRPALAGTVLARISAMAVCHGGIGTVPVFAKAKVPQLFVPHDLDQAVNAILAVRSGYGLTIDLRY